MGRNPEDWGKLFEAKADGNPIRPQQMVDGGFKQTIESMGTAEKSFAEFQVKSRLARAEAAGQRPLKTFFQATWCFSGASKCQEVASHGMRICRSGWSAGGRNTSGCRRKIKTRVLCMAT